MGSLKIKVNYYIQLEKDHFYLLYCVKSQFDFVHNLSHYFEKCMLIYIIPSFTFKKWKKQKINFKLIKYSNLSFIWHQICVIQRCLKLSLTCPLFHGIGLVWYICYTSYMATFLNRCTKKKITRQQFMNEKKLYALCNKLNSFLVA